LNEDANLLEAARQAALVAYAPYSHFRVGAAILCEFGIITGCNVENASFGLSICAERAAVFAAVARGARRITRVALACIDATADMPIATRMPCGACRQVLAEFAGPETPIFVDTVGIMTLGALLPEPFLKVT
jgi:cytidine deaminase